MLLALLRTPSLAPTTAWASTSEQAIDDITTGSEQQVQRLGTGDGEQQVVALDGDAAQAVGAQEPPSPAAKTAGTVARVLVGVTAAGIAIASGIASLLLF